MFESHVVPFQVAHDAYHDHVVFHRNVGITAQGGGDFRQVLPVVDRQGYLRVGSDHQVDRGVRTSETMEYLVEEAVARYLVGGAYF